MEQDKLQEARVQIVALDVRVTELETALTEIVKLMGQMADIQRRVVEKVTANG